MSALRAQSIVLLAVVASRCAEGRARYVNIKTQIERFGALIPFRPKVPLANVNRPVAVIPQDAGQRHVALLQSRPIPVRRTIWACVVLTWIDPVRGAMTGGVLPGHDRNPSRRTDAHGVELVESNPPICQPLHAGRAIIIVQRITLRLPVLVRQKRNGSIHDSHVINQKNHDVGVLCRRGRRCV